jgi:hypothetical protein
MEPCPKTFETGRHVNFMSIVLLYSPSGDISDSQVTGYGLEGRSWILGKGRGFFSLCHRVQTGSGPIQPPMQWVQGPVSPGVYQLGCETDHSPSSSAESKTAWSYTYTPQHVFTAWCLIKQ